jgi:hypothetical protein
MFNWNRKTIISKFNYVRPLTFHEFGYTLADPKISINLKQLVDNDGSDLFKRLLYITFFYSSDDEYGGSIDFEAQSILEINCKPQELDIEFLLEMVKQAMREVNIALKIRAASYGFGLTYRMAAFKQEVFLDDELLENIRESLYHFIESNY